MKLSDLHYISQSFYSLTKTLPIGELSTSHMYFQQLLGILGVAPTRVDEISDALELDRGRVFAVRWDITSGEVGFKLPVMASLLLYHIGRKKSSLDNIRVLCDGGNINTALALSHLSRILGLQAEHVLSRHFPESLRSYLHNRAGDVLTLLEAPATSLGKEREFYSHLVKLVREPSRRGISLCLWHAKYGGIATRWLGESFANTWDIAPDDIVLGVGSGSTLESFAIPLKQRFGSKPRIVVAEHAKSPLFNTYPVIANLVNRLDRPSLCSFDFRLPPSTIPHSILGPHYDEINPFLSIDMLNEVDGVIRYGDDAWQSISRLCSSVNMPVGNSSAANLAVARHLAAQGRTVFTFIYEHLRDFYLDNFDRQCIASSMTIPDTSHLLQRSIT